MKANHNILPVRDHLMWLLRISVFQRMKANHNAVDAVNPDASLLRISVFQRMKANHNVIFAEVAEPLVVTNLSISKNESKSQLGK